MRWSAKQFRWLALGGALLLAGVLAAFLGLAKYRAGKVWQQILKRNGVNLVQESNGITWSQSVKGRTVFTLHAEKSTPHGNGVYSLHNAVLILYGKDGRDDRIHGNEFEYDQGQGILKAIGEVHMDLQAPEPAGVNKTHTSTQNFSFMPDDEAAADPRVIHVRTSGLVFLRKLEVAATREAVEFSYNGMRCESVGAEFESGQGTLHLLADVKLAGTLRDAPFTLTAARADLDRGANTVTLESANWISGDRAARADHALLSLRKDGSLQKGDGTGNVVLRADTRTLSAPQAHVEFGAEDKPERTLFTGGVQFADRALNTAERGTSANLTLTANAQGVLSNAVADGNVQLHTDQQAAETGVTARRDLKAQHAVASFGVAEAGKQPLLRNLHLQGGAELLAVSAGKATAAGINTATLRAPETRTRVRADDLTTVFSPDARQRSAPQAMTGVGHTVLEQNAADGGRQVSEGDQLQAQFKRASGRPDRSGEIGAETVEVSRAVQTGHVVLHAWPAAKVSTGQVAGQGATAVPSVGKAERAVYEAEAGTLTLSGGAGSGAGERAELNDGSGQLSAPEIVLHQGSGDGEASGGVALTSVGQPGTPATHALATRARFLHAVDIAEFYGSDDEPAQMWQGSSQVSAAKLVLDGRRHTLTARPATAGALVHGTFATDHEGSDTAAVPGRAGHAGAEARSTGPAVTAGLFGNGASGHELASQRASAASGDAVQVAAEALDYSDPDHEATFHGHVVVHGAQGRLSGDRGVVFLQNGGSANENGAVQPAGVAGMGATEGMGGRLERFVLLGDVRLVQPGRSGQGRQLTYTAATDRFVLTGAPGALPRVQDAQQGEVTGETLVFGAAEKSVVVVGGPAAQRPALEHAGPAGRRVHTETDIKR